MTQLEEKFPVPLAIRSSSRVDLTRPKGGDRCDGGPCRRRPTHKKRMGWLTPSVPSFLIPCYFLLPLASLTESTGHDDDEIHFLCRHRVLPSFAPSKELPAKSTQHEPKAAGEMHAGVGGINLIYAP